MKRITTLILLAMFHLSSLESKPLKILVLYSNPIISDITSITDGYDGFVAAINRLSNKYSFTWHNLHENRPFKEMIHSYDIFLVKGSYNGLAKQFALNELPANKPKLYFLTSSRKIKDPSDLNNFDTVFYETTWARKTLLKNVNNCIHAFGINTDIFHLPDRPPTRDIDILCTSNLKYYRKERRVTNLLNFVGKKVAILSGTQPNDPIVTMFKKKSIKVLQKQTRHQLHHLYLRSKTVYIPNSTSAGGDRTLLEARSCGAKVMISNDNLKLKSLLDGPIYDHTYYANQIELGINQALNKLSCN